MSKLYQVNEVFISIQGEGKRAGTVNAFVRFAKCNMRCTQDPGPKSPGGFDCDTEFESGRRLTVEEIEEWIQAEAGQAGLPVPTWLILTGGEPGLQVDGELQRYFAGRGFKLAIETNGSVCLRHAYPFDWITVSPKVAEHAIRQRWAHEVKYVRGYGQAIPQTVVKAKHKLISPAFDGPEPRLETVEWCRQLVLKNPDWELTGQLHKLIDAR